MSKKILITGVAGFIGAAVAEKLLQRSEGIVGIDNLNNYYDLKLKEWRLEQLQKYPHFKFYKSNVEDFKALESIFKKTSFKSVIHEAARAGVRASLKEPVDYFGTNVMGTLNLLQLCVSYDVEKFILASTSSLYAGQMIPFKETLPVNTPISPYAASKKSAEVIAYTYHHLYQIDVSILRYFTVYGEAGRPDMSIFRFIKWLLQDKPLEVFGNGHQKRDFTYIDDIVEGTIKALKPVGYEIINLGSNTPYELQEMIKIIEKLAHKRAVCEYQPFPQADIKETWANIDKAKRILNWQPKVHFEEGLQKTIEWFQKNWSWVKKIEG